MLGHVLEEYKAKGIGVWFTLGHTTALLELSPIILYYIKLSLLLYLTE